MLDFGEKKPKTAPKRGPRNYFQRREQRKLLMLVLVLGTVLILVAMAADPNTWRRLGFGDSERAGAPQNAGPPPQPKYYDTRVRPEPPSDLPLDTFIVQADIPAVVDPVAKYYPGVRPELFSMVRDYAPFRGKENSSWFNLLGVLNRNTEQDLAKASVGDVGFVQLYQQMNVYRGQLVTIRGTAKRAYYTAAPENEEGIKGYHQIWVFPAGGPLSPIVVYSLDVPRDFPSKPGDGKLAENITEEVSLTGFAFKNWLYGADQRIESAPLLLAKDITWHKQVVEERKPVSMIAVALVVGGTALAALFFTSYVYWSSNRLGPSGEKVLARLHTASAGAAPQSNEQVAESLKTLTEIAAQPSGPAEPDSPPESATEPDSSPPSQEE